MIFKPSWSFETLTQQHKGTGLLGALWTIADQCLVFSVELNGTKIEVLPHQGIIKTNSGSMRIVKPGKLLWGRRVNLTIGGGKSSKDYPHYFIGIENGTKHGFKLFSDGRIEQGL